MKSLLFIVLFIKITYSQTDNIEVYYESDERILQIRENGSVLQSMESHKWIIKDTCIFTLGVRTNLLFYEFNLNKRELTPFNNIQFTQLTQVESPSAFDVDLKRKVCFFSLYSDSGNSIYSFELKDSSKVEKIIFIEKSSILDADLISDIKVIDDYLLFVLGFNVVWYDLLNKKIMRTEELSEEVSQISDLYVSDNSLIYFTTSNGSYCIDPKSLITKQISFRFEHQPNLWGFRTKDDKYFVCRLNWVDRDTVIDSQNNIALKALIKKKVDPNEKKVNQSSNYSFREESTSIISINSEGIEELILKIPGQIYYYSLDKDQTAHIYYQTLSGKSSDPIRYFHYMTYSLVEREIINKTDCYEMYWKVF